MKRPNDPHDATRARLVLGVTPAASDHEIKHRYRVLAREHHPDRGGDPDRFHEIRLAYDVLLGGATVSGPPPTGPNGGAAAWARAEARERGSAPVDLGSVDWDRSARVDAPIMLDRDLLAVLLVDRTVHAVPLSAASRKPGGRRRPWTAALSDEFVSTLRIAPAPAPGPGPGTSAVEMTFRFRPRHARRRALDAVWPIGWTRDRPTTDLVTARRRLGPSEDPRATAVRTADLVVEALAAIAWPLASWWVTPEGSEA